MARVSFRLRQTDADGGSHVRYDSALHGARDDYDWALRSSGVQFPPAEFAESFFSAVPVCYHLVSLQWAVPLATSLTATPQVMKVAVVFSEAGTPQTISSGEIIAETTDTFDLLHDGVGEGEWAYYSLFGNYRSSAGDDYWERFASIPVLVPRNFRSTEAMWQRIPDYYRNQDQQLATAVDPCLHLPHGTTAGPLYKFLSIFGFSADRMMTEIEYTTLGHDPAIAHGDILDVLSEFFGLSLRSQDLGEERLRSLLTDISLFRNAKGTKGAMEFYLQAVTGCEIDVDTVNQEITMYSQRVNYFPSPVDGGTTLQVRSADVLESGEPRPFSSSYYHSQQVLLQDGTSFKIA